jgi:hypothetical protein
VIKELAMPRSVLVAGFLVLLAAGCGKSSPVAPTPPVTTPPSPTAAPAARYRVTFDASWSAQSHPNDIPRNPHFSRLIGGTHRATVKFWEAGALASEGIRLMDWVAEKVVVLQPLDAGTDSGHTFSAADLRTAPAEPIHLIGTGPLVVGASVPPVGTFTFRRLG